MGNIIDSVPCTLTPADMERLAGVTVFNPVEIRAIWYYYHYLNNQQEKITKSQFQDAILFRDSILLDGIFKAFDLDNDGLIDFNEYILCISTVSSKAPADDKLKLSFKIYDLDGDGVISTKDLTKVVADTMREQDVVIHKVDVEQIVEQTMKEANPKKPGFISYEEYLDLVVDRPYLLSHLTLNISSIISEYTSKTGHAFKSPRPL